MWSVFSRRNESSTSRMIHRRDPPRVFGSSLIGMKNLVARNTSARRPASASPRISSDSPPEYTSAVSTKLIPASRARWTMRMESAWSALPHGPNIIVPRQSGLTWTPVRPSGRYCMTFLLSWLYCFGLVTCLMAQRVSLQGASGGRRVVLVVDGFEPGGGRPLGGGVEDREMTHHGVRSAAVPVLLT